MSNIPEELYALKSFRDAGSRYYVIGEPVDTSEMTEKTYQHYLASGMVSEEPPEVPNPKTRERPAQEASAQESEEDENTEDDEDDSEEESDEESEEDEDPDGS